MSKPLTKRWALSPERMALIAGLLIVFGFAPTSFADAPRRLHPAALPFLLLPLCPWLPLAITSVSALSPLRLPSLPIGFVAGMVLIAGALLSLLSAALSGVGTSMVLLAGLVLTGAIASNLLLFAASPGLRELSRAGSIVGIVASVWSLLCVPWIAIQANWRAGGAPFCIGHHDSSKAVGTFADLRGVRLYSTSSGYKDSSRWFFHAVLIVGAPRVGTFNWSPLRLRFDPILRPTDLIRSPWGACTPRTDFWRSRSIL